MNQSDFTNEEYLEMLNIVSRCRKDRLPYVLAMLKLRGIDLDDAMAIADADELSDKVKSENRRHSNTEKWKNTENKTMLRMRKCYENGMNMYALSRATGMNRTSLYAYMWGTRGIKPHHEEKINAGIDKLEAAAEDQTA